MGGEGSRTELDDSTPFALGKFLQRRKIARTVVESERKLLKDFLRGSHLQFHGQCFPKFPFFYESRVKVLNSSVQIRVEMASRHTRSLVIPHVSPVCTIVVHRARKIIFAAKFSLGDR
jgi:hypothetical protein